jgi:hypothetical protein
MIANELERSVAEYLAAQYGTPAGAGGNPIPVAVRPELVTGDPIVLNIHQGEGVTEIHLPAVIVSCDTTTPEDDSSNAMATLNIMVRIQADVGPDNPNPLGRLDELSRVMFDSMLVDDIHHRVNQFRGSDFTVHRFVTQSQQKTARERILEHLLTNTVYCANVDLIGT